MTPTVNNAFAGISATRSQRKRLVLVSAAILATSALVAPALAQEALAPGEAVSTQFRARSRSRSATARGCR